MLLPHGSFTSTSCFVRQGRQHRLIADRTPVLMSMSSEERPSDEFVKRLTESQSHLMGFIMASVGDYADASDILQQTNVVLLRKFDNLEDLEGFLPWAITVAKFQVLGYVRDKSRGRMLLLPDVVEAMVDTAVEEVSSVPHRLSALRECLGNLPENKRQLLLQRYTLNTPLKTIAARSRCTVDSVKGRLKRIRQLLSHCIDGRLESSAR